MKDTDTPRVHVSLDPVSLSAIDKIADTLRQSGQRGDRSSVIRHALITTARRTRGTALAV